MIINATLKRYKTGEYGTFSSLRIANDEICKILEPPWRDNKKNVSCIPTGTYLVAPHISPRYGKCFKLYSMDGSSTLYRRTDILFHPGNIAVDTPKKDAETHGCLLTGEDEGMVFGIQGVVRSVKALRKLLKLIGDNIWQLTITEEYSILANIVEDTTPQRSY